MSSYNSKWQEKTTKILERLKFDLQATDIFPKENVKILGAFAQWTAKYDRYPNALIRFVNDRIGFATADEEEHLFLFQILISMKSKAKPEEDTLDYLDVIGQVEEALRDDNTLDGNCDWLLIREKDLTYGWSEGYLFYEALLNVEVHATW